MAELKRTFVKGGMNLDLDERLVGQGYYREAYNVRISSSSEGNEGSLETIRSNIELDSNTDGGSVQPGAFGPYPPFVNNLSRSSIVGTVVDRKNDLAYHFHSNSVRTNYPFADNNPISDNFDENANYDNFVETTVKADSIYEFNPKTNEYNLVFNDIYEIQSEVDGFAVDEDGQTFLTLPNLQDLDIREDMRVFQMNLIIGFQGQQIETPNAPINENLGQIYVDRVDRVNNRVFLKDLSGSFAVNVLAPLNYVRFRSKRILNFNHQQQKGYITGLNVFDGFIFFTDGNNEPKKINIERSKHGTLSAPQANNSVSWLSDRRYFHTRLLMPNRDNLPGFQGIPYYDFFGDIDAGTGGVIELNCTVIRPNPEEHLKVLSDVGFIETEQTIVGPNIGVMTQPFPIHPIWEAGKQLQFALAFTNEVGFFRHIPNVNDNTVLGLDDIIDQDAANLTDGPNAPYTALYGNYFLTATPGQLLNQVVNFSNVYNLSVDDGFSMASWCWTHGPTATLAQQTLYVGAGNAGNTNVFPQQGNIYLQGYHPSNAYALFNEFQNSNYRVVAFEHSNLGHRIDESIALFNSLGNGSIDTPGIVPSVVLADVDNEEFSSTVLWTNPETGAEYTMFDLWDGYLGTSGMRTGPWSGVVEYGNPYDLLEYFDTKNPKMTVSSAVSQSLPYQSGDTHFLRKAFHRGGLLGQTNAIGGADGFDVVSSYWGISNEEANNYIHNGWIDFNEDNLLRPTGPGRFVIPPHNFRVGDIVILEGKGNTIVSNAISAGDSKFNNQESQYVDVNLAGEQYITEAATIYHYEGQDENLNPSSNYFMFAGNFGMGNVETTSGNQGNQLLTGALTNNPYGEQQSRRHDGYGDRVRAKIVKIEQVNMRETDVVISTVDEDGERIQQIVQGGWKDLYGNEYFDLTQKFLFLDKKMVNNYIYDGSNPEGEGDLPPSFFSTKSKGSQYIFTIEIIQNNLKQVYETSLRADLSRDHVNFGNLAEAIGYGDVTKNAAMMENNHIAKRSPYFDTDQGFGFVSGPVSGEPLQYGPENLPMYYGPPLPQVWSVSLESAIANNTLADDQILKEQMLRFSYRYQYIDNEYSGLAPFTTVIWRTLNQKIDWPNYYISLINEIKKLDLIDWRPKNIPKDVKAIELLMKSEEANNIYAIKKYEFKDFETLLPANGTYNGVHRFEADTLGLTIDPNQILRSFDSVPRSALAQEVIANRIIYGNYLKDYNLEETKIIPQLFQEDDEIPHTINVNLSVELFHYINQTQTDIVDVNGNSVTVGLTPEDNIADQFEGQFASQINANFGIPLESIKSYRSYQVGIVYRDDYGRETPVLTNKNAVIKVDPQQAKISNRIKVTVKNPHPSWAKSYKFFVKDTSLDYHVITLEEAFHFVKNDGTDDVSSDPDQSSEALSVLVFSSNDRNKIQEGDILIQKRAHFITGPPDPILSTSTFNYEPDNDALEYEVQKIQNEPPKGITAALTFENEEGDSERLDGKFFVFVKTDRPLVVNNATGPLPGANTTKTQGVFETRPKPNYDSDLYFEASQAYPIVMDDETDEQFIKPGRMVQAFVYTPGANYDGTLVSNASVSPLDTFFPTEFGLNNGDGFGGVGISDLEEITPITVLAVNTLSGRRSENDQIFTEIVLSQNVTLTAPVFPSTLVLRIQEHRGNRHNVGEYVHVAVVGGVANSSRVIVRRHTHVSNFNLTNNIALPITLPWYNCFTFGNGIEIATARNSFNGARIQKGVKASTTYEDYAEVRESESLIFSGVYNSYSDFNETNQFIEALGITKRFNPDHGSVQKLFTRSNDLLVLCEDKIIQVLADKDAVFKADANPDLVATNRVLGQSVAFDGEYGISRNPESFAHYGFRSYFTDAKRGVVLRLSKDGLTVISEVGMDSYFKEQLNFVRTDLFNDDGYVFGSYDIDSGEYIISSERFLSPTGIDDELVQLAKGPNYGVPFEGVSVAWDEGKKVWSSFRTYLASAQGYTINNNYYVPYTRFLYHHNHFDSDYGYFSGYHGATPVVDGEMLPVHEPRVAVVYNEMPGIVKDFTYVNYEGTKARIISDYTDEIVSTDVDEKGWWLSNITTDLESAMSINFRDKENKWHNYFNKYSSSGPISQDDASATLSYGVNPDETVGLGNIKSVAVNDLYPDGSIRTLDVKFDFDVDVYGYTRNGEMFDAFFSVLNEAELDPTSSFDSTQFIGMSITFKGSSMYLLLPNPVVDGNQAISTHINNFLNNFVFVNGFIIDQQTIPPSTLYAFFQETSFIQEPIYLSSGIKGYFARGMWRNNDYTKRSELFSTAVNAVESSK